MRTDRWERFGAVSGLVVVGATVVAFFSVPSSEDFNASLISAHRGGVITRSYLLSIVALALVWFAGTLRTTLRRAEGGLGRVSSIAFAGGGVAAALLLVAMATHVAAAMPGRPQDPAQVDLLTDVGAVLLTFIWMPIALLIGGTALVSWRTGLFPRWHAIIGSVVAVSGVAVGLQTYGTRGFWSLENGTNGIDILMAAFLLWTLATSILLFTGEPEVIEAATSEHGAKVVWHARKAG